MSKSALHIVVALCLGSHLLGETHCVSPTLPEQCAEYMILDDPGRSVYASNTMGDCLDDDGDWICYCDEAVSSQWTSPDWQGSGYYRLLFPAGAKLPESSPGYKHCGTKGPGWLRGEHPQDVGAEENMIVCFDYGEGCDYTADITVTNCDGYYVYMLPDTPDCLLRYCAAN